MSKDENANIQIKTTNTKTGNNGAYIWVG